jgi:lysozyme
VERRNIESKGLAIVSHFEGEYNPKCGWIADLKMYKPYIDAVGIPTIGIGTIAYPNGQRVTMNDRAITVEQAYEYMNFELDEKEDAVTRMATKAGLTFSQCQFDALVSMAYNCGIGILEVGSSLRTALISKDILMIERAMKLYCKGTVKKWGIRRKVTLPGLVRRRKSEFTLFSKDTVIFYQ